MMSATLKEYYGESGYPTGDPLSLIMVTSCRATIVSPKLITLNVETLKLQVVLLNIIDSIVPLSHAEGSPVDYVFIGAGPSEACP